jgi:type I restriction enzyme S subunit
MNQGEKALPTGWKWEKLGNSNISIISAGGTPRRSVNSYYQGCIPWSKIGDLTQAGKYIKETEEYINEDAILNSNAKVFPKETVLISMYGSIGKAAIASVPIATNQAIVGIQLNINILEPEYLYYFLTSIQAQLENLGRGATQNNINAGHIKDIDIPIPPLPVQERIIHILQKADEIRRKRQEAVAIADAILPAIFNEMFGDCDKNSNWVERTVGSVLCEEPDNGKSPSKKKSLCSADVLTLTAVRNGRLNLEEKKYSTFDIADVSKYYIKKGDAFVVRGNGNINLMGRIALYDGDDVEIVYPDTLIRLRFNNELVLSEFMKCLWDTQIIRNQIVAKSNTTNGTNKINQGDVKSITFPCPLIDIQHQFLVKAQASFSYLERENNAKNDSHALFSSLLSRAFTGELTAEWETTNAQQIAATQKFYQRLPQLIILSFLKEKINRIQRQKTDTAVLVTALMKYVFLFQMEGVAKRRLYQFIPYHYGPFAKELYTDLETLQEQGLIAVDDSDEDKTRISLFNSEVVEAELAELPADLQADIEAIIDSYGDLDLTSLLATVYEKYPAYAKKSKLKQRKPKPKKEEN